jgi:cytochrome c oxidase cbb3-type subunit III
MQRRRVSMGVIGLTFTLAVGLRAQQPPAHGGPEAAPPPQPTFQAPRPQFPAHQRPPVAQEVLDKGKAQYAALCSACHGGDARGGQLGGVNLLRSQLVLDDKDAELIGPVVKNGRPGPPPMPPLPLADDEIKAVAAYLHHLQGQGTNQGGPPPGTEPVLNILVGDAKAGETFFAARCGTCHSPTGDLQGVATRAGSAMNLQNLWVSGGLASPRGPGRRRGGGPAAGRPVTATVTLANGEKVSGRLLRLDDFLVTLAFEDGTTRTIRRSPAGGTGGGATPRVEVQDPLAPHRALLSTLTNANMHDVTAYLATLK